MCICNRRQYINWLICVRLLLRKSDGSKWGVRAHKEQHAITFWTFCISSIELLMPFIFYKHSCFSRKISWGFFFFKFQDSSASTFRSTKGGLGSNRTGQVGRLYLWDFGVKKKAPQAVSSLPAIKESMELNVLNRVVFQGKEGAKGIPNSEILEAKELLEDSEAHN